MGRKEGKTTMSRRSAIREKAPVMVKSASRPTWPRHAGWHRRAAISIMPIILYKAQNWVSTNLWWDGFYPGSLQEGFLYLAIGFHNASLPEGLGYDFLDLLANDPRSTYIGERPRGPEARDERGNQKKNGLDNKWKHRNRESGESKGENFRH